MTVCKELVSNSRLAGRSDLGRFDRLHLEGRGLIAGWFQRAWMMRDCSDHETFEPFIFTWIAFNGWAACVTGLDKDKDWLDALMLDTDIANRFSSLLNASASPLAAHATMFQQTWPIFKAQDLRRRGLHSNYDFRDRRQIVGQYLMQKVPHEPKCWERHEKEGVRIPLDWPHTLAVLYRVRCNLFHGEKTLHSEIDRRIVADAFRVLAWFLAESGFIEP